jgi:AAA domain/UvrD-like helicase C-terminal domain
MPRIERAIGGAGTGKTRLILDRLSAAKREMGLSVSEIGFATFTRAGRQEIASRASEAWDVDVGALDWFRTAHSIAYRQCGVEDGQLIAGKDGDEWMGLALGGRVNTMIDARGERRYVAGGDDSIPIALRCWELARSTMTPLPTILERIARSGERCPSPPEIFSIVEKYEHKKKADGRCDYTDLIARFAGVKFTLQGPEQTDPAGECPESLRILAVDEAQDSSALVDRVCKRLAYGGAVERVWICGDPYQCQPAGTPVLTLSGYKNIEDLDPSVDRLVAFSRRESRFSGTGSEFEIASREVDSSSLIEITLADGTKHVSTENHKWVVRTRGRQGVYATYLMSRGSRWRIGTVKMFSEKPNDKNGSFRLKMRMNQEAAESAWILKVFDTDREARCYEQIVSCKYGIPQVTFRPPCGVRTNLDEGYIEQVFNTLGDLTKNGEACLASHGLSPECPMCVKADRCKNGPMASRLIHAANLLPGIHLVPKMRPDKKCEWVEVVSCRRLQAGDMVRVWSMNVQKYHTYITKGGVVTGNSIHGFAGGDYRLFMSWDAVESTMPKSYRCPDSVLKLGERCLSRMMSGYHDRGIQPASHDGSVRTASTVDEAISLIKPDTSCLILGRCGYSIELYEQILRQKQVPYRWVDRGHSEATVDGFKALWAIQSGEVATGNGWGNAVSMLAVSSKEHGQLLTRGEKAAWQKGQRADFDLILPTDEDLATVGVQPPLATLIRTGRWYLAVEPKIQERAEQWLRAATAYGPEIASNPPIKLSTIHGAKGLEAETVILSSVTSPKVERARMNSPECHDEECRIEYVAVTRARRNFIGVQDGVKHRMELPI